MAIDREQLRSMVADARASFDEGVTAIISEMKRTAAAASGAIGEVSIDEAFQAVGRCVADRVAQLTDTTPFDFVEHLRRQRSWSEQTFGPGPRTAGVIDHIRKELVELEQQPTDASEWADVVILGLDGFWRAGYTPEQIVAALVAKQTKNEGRTWPDWRTAPLDKAIEHDRSKDAS